MQLTDSTLVSVLINGCEGVVESVVVEVSLHSSCVVTVILAATDPSSAAATKGHGTCSSSCVFIKIRQIYINMDMKN